MPLLPISEKMVTSEALDGVPILVLANKQDVEVSLPHLPRTPCTVSAQVHRALLRPLLAVQGTSSPGRGGVCGCPLSCSLWLWETHVTHRKL